MSIDLLTAQGRAGLDALVADPARALVAFDYDGTLADIVDDPTQAVPRPEVVDGLVAMSSRVALVAIVTGRPAQWVVDLAEFDTRAGLERLVVLGHYGAERWDAATGELQTVDPPAGLKVVRSRLGEVLASLDLSGADVEDKGLSLAVHVRRLPDPADAFARMEPVLGRLAADEGLVVEPGRMVVELRPAGMDKGQALGSLADETDARTLVFAGDDLGDVSAFREVERRRSSGLAGLLVCSGSTEVTALADLADVVVGGPAGVATFVADLLAELGPS